MNESGEQARPTKKAVKKARKTVRKAAGRPVKHAKKTIKKKSTAREDQHSTNSLVTLVSTTHEEWLERVFNPFEVPGKKIEVPSKKTTATGSQPGSALHLDLDLDRNAVNRYSEEDIKSAPFPSGQPLIWPDAVGLFVDQAVTHSSNFDPVLTFWSFEPRRGQIKPDGSYKGENRELFVLSDGNSVVDFDLPVLQIQISTKGAHAFNYEKLAVPGENTSGWKVGGAPQKFGLSSLLVGAIDRAQKYFGYYCEGPVAIRATKGDRFYGFKFDAFINCRRGELKTHTFQWF